MGFENFALARDLLYLTFALMGAALGCALHYFRKKPKAPFRNRMISFGLVLLSGALVSFTVAIVITNGAILRAFFLLIPAGILALVFVLACRFPKAAAFPLIVLAGVVTIWIGFSCFRFPHIDAGGSLLARIYDNGSGDLVIRFNYPAGMDGVGEKPNLELAIPRTGQETVTLDVQAVCFYFDERFPLIGGDRRGFITAINHNEIPLFWRPFIEDRLYLFQLYAAPLTEQRKFPRFGIYYENRETNIMVDAAMPGMYQLLVFNGNNFSLRPSWQTGVY